MRKMTQGEIKTVAKNITDCWLMGYSLPNAKKIELEVRRLLLAEGQRRKTTEQRPKQITKKNNI